MINNDDNDNPTIISNSKTVRLISSDSVNPDRLTRTKKSNVKFKNNHQYKQSASFGGDQQSESHCNPSTKSEQTAQMAMTFMLTSI